LDETKAVYERLVEEPEVDPTLVYVQYMKVQTHLLGRVGIINQVVTHAHPPLP
jgi:hypothetical protein